MENTAKIGNSSEKPRVSIDRRLSVAPMMDWTDCHCRFVHRLFAPHALLYTEMIVSTALVRGDARRLLEHSAVEHPVALQLGGCDPKELAAAARIGAAAGFAEINLNVGCPSDRVRNGSFGACLMLKPALVAECVRALKQATPLPVTVKCRIGIDDRDDYEFFAAFVDAVAGVGITALIVHARNAILGGLSPKENREIPPLKYDYVHQLKRERPGLTVVLNGGLSEVPEIRGHIAAGLDGVMLGRAAYHRPALLAELEQAIIDPAWRVPEPREIIERVVSYAKVCARRGIRLHSITRHMHGLMAGREGARAWRRFLSEVAARPEAVPETLYSALPIVNPGVAA
ncbi:MAG TPA: tRNA dihydrouridine(20/20a) synthase DusA [Steroidobacteraceae bacterium]|jgi:tRNA-dihydrouridine synthase A|nr:tRNA dihydrouridine(20/20a) synthase DusA [Steroidobacteraceae bacterium]